jgi:preprotein translocase subunit YajC
MLIAAVQGSNGAGGGMTMLLLQFVGIGAVFYFLILRPQGQARKRHAEMLTNLKKGDEVMTSGGLVGRVKEIKEVDFGAAKETRVTVETGTSTVVVERSRIVRVGTGNAALVASGTGTGTGTTAV